MTETAASDAVPPPPTADALAGLPTDVWAALLPTVRAALNDVDDVDASPALRRLRAAPTSRLAGGRVRREVCALFAAGGAAWDALYRRLVADDLARGWAERLRDEPLPTPPARPPKRQPPPASAAPEGELARVRDRLREVREQRDALQRRLDGAEGRVRALEREAEAFATEARSLRERVEELQRRLAAADEERERAVARERRRGEAAQADLRDEVSALRRAEQERRAEQSRALDRQRQEQAARQRTERQQRRRKAERPPRVVPGRPSQLPRGVVGGTAEAVSMLLHPGRLVLVDGYNVTRQHRDHLDLETQRSWLIQLLATAALQRRVRPVVVFDGEQQTVTREGTSGREVEVRFTPSGITADDELVLAVEATDEPVLVVTDDRELRARVSVSGADLAGTDAFLWALG